MSTDTWLKRCSPTALCPTTLLPRDLLTKLQTNYPVRPTHKVSQLNDLQDEGGILQLQI